MGNEKVTIDLAIVNKLSEDIHEFITERKYIKNMTKLEVILALAQVPIMQFRQYLHEKGVPP